MTFEDCHFWVGPDFGCVHFKKRVEVKEDDQHDKT
jgi:hypothetical protein